MLLYGEPGEVYNICSGQAYRISELISLAADVAGVHVEVELSKELLRESDKVQAVIWGDPSRLHALGWVPQVQMRDLIAQMLETCTTCASEGAVQAEN